MTPTARNLPRFPYRVAIEPRLNVPGWLPAAVSLGAVAAALLLGALVLALVGGDPWAAYAHIARAAFGELGVFSDTLVKATPLILTGLACAVAFRMKLWNIGAEGQFFAGALGASALVLSGVVNEAWPQWLVLPVLVAAGMLCGALWSLLPGLLRAYLRVNEIITTGDIVGVDTDTWLPRLADFAREVPAFRGLTTHLGLLLAVLAALAVWYILYRSLWGYEIRLIGDNDRAAEYAGLDIRRNLVLVLMLSGALAGLAGMSEITGVVHRLQTNISPGYGFSGINVAWLAKLNPLLVIPVAILFGGLILAGREIQPAGVPRLIQGIILFMLIASEVLLRYRVRIDKAAA